MVLPDPAARRGPFDRTIWITGAGGLWEAANMLVRRQLFDRVGGFPDGLQPPRGKALAEDVFFGYRAVRTGARTAFCPRALAYHAVFPRSWRGYAAERQRLAYFPAMVRAAPELRSTFLYRRAFLNERTARLDLGLVGAILALLRRSPLPLVAALPYLQTVAAQAARADSAGPSRTAVAAADVAADLVGAAAMARGSLRYRSPVL
jgi:hypothetical protein